MSWLKIDDGFEDHPKVEGLSHEAHRLWLRAACWCRKPVNARRNDGFVPAPLLEQIAKRMAPLARLQELAQELVDATAGGLFEVGLWEPVEGGWLFHDWADYQPKPDPMTREDAARAAGRRSAEVRRATKGTAQPERSPNVSRTSSNRSADVREQRQTTQPERSPNEGVNVASTLPERPERRSEVRPPQQPSPFSTADASWLVRTPAERPEPPDPDPDPVPRKAAAKALSGGARELSGREAAAATLASKVREQAAEIVEAPDLVRELRPHTWPEVMNTARAWHLCAGLPSPRLGEYSTDADVRALVGLLAAGWPPDELVELAPLVGTWLAGSTPDSRPRTLAMVTPAVLRIAQQQLAQTAAVEREARELVSATAEPLASGPPEGWLSQIVEADRQPVPVAAPTRLPARAMAAGKAAQ